MEAQLTRPHYTSQSQSWRDIASKLYAQNPNEVPLKPLFIAECDYQVESDKISSLSPRSAALSFERLSKDYGRGTRNSRLDVAPTTFTCFKSLPAELRLLIWGMACGQQRNVNIGFRSIADDLFTYASNTPAPGVLYTCRESRDEGLKYYKLCFGTSFNSAKLSIAAQPRILCNFKADTICLDLNFKLGWIGQHYEDFFMKAATTDMSSLAFNIDHFIGYNPTRRDFEVDWSSIFRIVDAYGGRSSVLREIILYHDMEEKPKSQPVGSEFVELDWSAMDPDCQKMQQLQTVQRDLLRDFPKWWQASPSLREVSSPRRLWADIQSKVKLMDLKVNYRQTISRKGRKASRTI
ncbi:hypothetical protein DSL72_008616 [Monilinia vaccinii-corymbosi]|uniref:2EXR domain-containing protein n=1 Tax=Monilinia vaccinii-corymbosi TaxID=61207 RepID=A0A8A3PPY7_9HELO|nr:hypothetical protein DSL72_008616 [Monilinia vaccinii-corymbosi]